MTNWVVTDELVDSVTKDIQESTGYSDTALASRIRMALDSLDAKHLDALVRILSIVILQVRQLANEKARIEDEGQERQYAEMARREYNMRIRALD